MNKPGNDISLTALGSVREDAALKKVLIDLVGLMGDQIVNLHIVVRILSVAAQAKAQGARE